EGYEEGRLPDLVVGVPVLFFLVVVLVEVVVVEVVVVLAVEVGKAAGTLAKQPVVVALLEFPRPTEPARSSFSGHVVTCLGVRGPLCRAVPRSGPFSAERWTRTADGAPG